MSSQTLPGYGLPIARPARTASLSAAAVWTVALALVFNALLSIVNAHVMRLGGAHVALVEACLLGLALLLIVRGQPQRWVAMASLGFFYCVVDTDEGSLTFANAGHYPPLLVRADGSIERLANGGAVLGVFPDGSYGQGQVSIASGDRLVLYTDGITEARNGFDEEFGEERLAELAVADRGCSAPALQSRLASSVTTFADGRFHDDATLMVMAVD